jgi:aspartate/methionine/tyrosine aminotransferase
MPIDPFKLERFFAKYEFKVKYLLSSSDCESLSMAELIEMATPESQALWQGLRLGYTESPGHPLLREEVAHLYQAVAPEGVLVAAPEEAIYVAMQSMLKPEDHLVVVSPVYQSLYEIARSIGCDVSPWRLEAGEKGWQLDINQLEDLINDRTRMLVINFPHNPTGHTIKQADLEAIVSLARKHSLYIFSDEMYRLLEPDPAIQLPAICDLYEKGISLSGLSKAFALPGLRMGWLATQESPLTGRWLAFKDYTTICNSAPSEILAIIALQNKKRILQRSIEIVRKNRDIAERFFSGYAHLFAWLQPLAGSVAFPKWLGAGSVEQFCKAVLDQQGVMIVPGSLFDFPGSHFRIGLGRLNFQEGLEKVNAFLVANS